MCQLRHPISHGFYQYSGTGYRTLLKKCGSPPSRLNPNIILEFDVIEKRPQCQTQTMIKVIKARAPLSPKISINICRTGCSYSLPTVPSKFCIEKRRDTRTKKPKRAEHPTDIRTPIGAFHEALFVSSDKCADASSTLQLAIPSTVITYNLRQVRNLVSRPVFAGDLRNTAIDISGLYLESYLPNPVMVY